VSEDDLAEAVPELGEDGSPIAGLVRRHGDLSPQQLHDPVEQRLLVLQVAVEGHRIDAELRGDPTHRQGVDTVLVDEVEGGAQHRVAIDATSTSA
jgi:hypothetical protein